jgi:hypothetical protein
LALASRAAASFRVSGDVWLVAMPGMLAAAAWAPAVMVGGSRSADPHAGLIHMAPVRAAAATPPLIRRMRTLFM